MNSIKHCFLVMVLLLSLQVSAQSEPSQVSAQSVSSQVTVAEVFKAMPDSLMPYLSTNNRLDMIDFMEAKMKAEVTNLLDGTSEMTFLSTDSLSIQLSKSLRIDMQLQQRDSTVVCFRRVYQTLTHHDNIVTTYYSTNWQLIEGPFVTSTLLKRDDELLK